jgi:hypothetical protein
MAIHLFSSLHRLRVPSFAEQQPASRLGWKMASERSYLLGWHRRPNLELPPTQEQ